MTLYRAPAQIKVYLMLQVHQFFKQLFDEVIAVSWPLFKLMVPIILIVKVLEEVGGIALLGQWLGPLMALVGLTIDQKLQYRLTPLAL